jgi:hypothetical protein
VQIFLSHATSDRDLVAKAATMTLDTYFDLVGDDLDAVLMHCTLGIELKLVEQSRHEIGNRRSYVNPTIKRLGHPTCAVQIYRLFKVFNFADTDYMDP